MNKIKLALTFLIITSSYSMQCSNRKSLLKMPAETPKISMQQIVVLKASGEIQVQNWCNLNGPEFSYRLNGLRNAIDNEIKNRQLVISKKECDVTIKNKKLQKNQSYKNAKITLGSSSVGVGISSLHNNARHWYSSK